MATPIIRVTHRGLALIFPNATVRIGGRLGVEVVLRDFMVAEHHCTIEHDGGFRVSDNGSVTGTWVDGEPASPSTRLSNGARIVVGTTEMTVSIRAEPGSEVLELTVTERGFRWWKQPAKEVFDNDPDLLVHDEVGFSRFRALSILNRLACGFGVALLLGALLAAAVLEHFADAGGLQPTHAVVADAELIQEARGREPRVAPLFIACAEVAATDRCAACHTPGHGVTEAACMKCHSLPGELGAAGSWRHPYLRDGNLGTLAGMDSGQGFCVLCHTDHSGKLALKPIAAEFVGKCERCHPAGDANVDRAQVRSALLGGLGNTVPPPEQTPYDNIRFPHASHLEKRIECGFCHHEDPGVVADIEKGLPDDPSRHDFAVVSYETCRPCHVPGFERDLPADAPPSWRSQKQWPVTWHGTDDQGRFCRQCHAAVVRDSRQVFGPERKTVARPSLTPAEHAAQRARYTHAQRRHAAQFAKHAGGLVCRKCHIDDKLSKLPEDEEDPKRTFWHCLHVDPGSLHPGNAADAATVSANRKSGCISCHRDLGQSKSLLPAKDGAFHWPESLAAQEPCLQCHREGEGQTLPLRAASVDIQREKTRDTPDFPHDIHLNSPSFAKTGTLFAGCFSCHDFSPPLPNREFTDVPTTQPSALDCSKCHKDHANVGGDSCQQCHPAQPGRSNWFLVTARVNEPPKAERLWPAPNRFSHLSRGHRVPELTCAKCHDDLGLDKAMTLADVRVLDESAKLCRDCHLNEAFHWR